MHLWAGPTSKRDEQFQRARLTRAQRRLLIALYIVVLVSAPIIVTLIATD